MPNSRRRFFHTAAALATACGLDQEHRSDLGLRHGLVSPLRPDILFISIDDLNDWPTPFEGPKPTVDPGDILTPNIEHLASIGTVFQRAYCASPMCGPSRSATLTGLPPHVSGVTQQENILDPKDHFGPLLVKSVTTLPRILQSHGYVTQGVGKVFHGGGYKNDVPHRYDAPAWDEWEIVDNRLDDDACPQSFDADGSIDSYVRPCPEDLLLPDARVATFTVDRLLDDPGPAPLFLAAGFFKPHKPFEVPASYYGDYPLERIKQLDPFVEQLDQDDLTLSGCASLRDLAASPEASVWDKRTRAAIAAYLACVTHTDAMLGEIIKALLLRPRRTILILWSDHGYFMGEKRGWKKTKLYERAARVPLLIVDTAQLLAQNTTKIVSLTDLFPTVLDYAGVPHEGHGRSLRPLVEDVGSEWSQTSVVTTFNFKDSHTPGKPDLEACMEARDIDYGKACAYPNRLEGASHALRTERPGEHYRYIRYHEEPDCFSADEEVPTRELYDLEVDPTEQTNLLAPDNATPEFDALAAALDAELDAALA